jgi:hypothetical protein
VPDDTPDCKITAPRGARKSSRLDGRRFVAFNQRPFNTPDPLAPHDFNARQDIYLYRQTP